MMRNQWLEKESKRWEEDEIISSEQRKKILALYPKQTNTSIFFAFALILLSLALLTFLASNWTDFHPLARTAILLIALVGLYSLGWKWIEEGKRLLGEVSLVLAILLFGLSIFLIGDMYHFHFNSVFSFIIWSLFAFILYISYPSRWIWLTGVVVLVTGQLFDLISFRDFSWLLFALFMLGYGWTMFRSQVRWMAWIFGIAYFIQMVGFSSELLSSYWLSAFLAILYFLGVLLNQSMVGAVFRRAAHVGMFLFVVFHVLFLTPAFERESIVDIEFFFVHVFLMSLMVLYLYSKKDVFSIFQLVIFVPLFMISEAGDYLAAAALFIFSVAHLMEGFQARERSQMNFGTAAFLISTLVVYAKVAWGYLSQSLFFLSAGLILLAIGFLLKRQQKLHAGQEGEKLNDS